MMFQTVLTLPPFYLALLSLITPHPSCFPISLLSFLPLSFSNLHNPSVPERVYRQGLSTAFTAYNLRSTTVITSTAARLTSIYILLSTFTLPLLSSPLLRQTTTKVTSEGREGRRDVSMCPLVVHRRSQLLKWTVCVGLLIIMEGVREGQLLCLTA